MAMKPMAQAKNPFMPLSPLESEALPHGEHRQGANTTKMGRLYQFGNAEHVGGVPGEERPGVNEDGQREIEQHYDVDDALPQRGKMARRKQ